MAQQRDNVEVITNFNPNDFVQVTSDFNPNEFEPDELPVQNEEGLLERTYDFMFNAPKQITDPVDRFADDIAAPGLDDSVLSAQLKGFIGGAAGGAARLLSPANILTLGRGILPQLAARILGGAEIAHGGHEIASGNIAEGVGDLAFGALDIGSSYPRRSVVPNKNPSQQGLAKPNHIERAPLQDTEAMRLRDDADLIPRFSPNPPYVSFANEFEKVVDDLPLNRIEPALPKLDEPALNSQTAQPSAQAQQLNELPIANSQALTPQIITTPRHVQKLIDALEGNKPLNREQTRLLSQERAGRVGEASGVETEGLPGLYEELGLLKGEYSKVQGQPLRLDQNDVTSLFQQIKDFPGLQYFQTLRARIGISKLLEGKVLQENEIKLLERIFGPELIKSLPKVDQKKSLLSDLINLPRSLMATMDFSAPLRQGLPMIHRKEWWTSWDDMFKSFGSEEAFQAVQKDVMNKWSYDLGQEVGLRLTDLTDMSKREEQFMSTLAERIPGIGRVVRASNRSYVAFLNKLRADSFENLVKQMGAEHNLPLAKSIADYVNTSTGRGNLGRFEKSAGNLNAVFFAPRLIASRVQMLNPNYYWQQPSQVRKEALKSLFAAVGAGTAIANLGRLAGADVESNPTNADFGKMQIGNTRLDPYAGFQQYAVVAARLLSGETTSSRTDRTSILGEGFGRDTRFDIAERFVGNKLAPVPNFVYTLLKQKGPDGRPIHVPTEIAERVVPMMIQDIYEIMQDDPTLLPLAIPAAFGMGAQSYR